MALMYDSITAANLPAGGACYAGYANGRYANLPEIAARFPDAPLEAIDVLNAGVGTVLDVEAGDAVPGDIPGWLAARTAGGVARPAPYASLVTWIEDICGQILTLPQRGSFRMWTAHYTGTPHLCDSSCLIQAGGVTRSLPAGWIADATQYADPGPYDISLLGPAWLTAPTPPPTPPPTPVTPAWWKPFTTTRQDNTMITSLLIPSSTTDPTNNSRHIFVERPDGTVAHWWQSSVATATGTFPWYTEVLPTIPNPSPA